jgi:hypothetical protein
MDERHMVLIGLAINGIQVPIQYALLAPVDTNQKSVPL